MKNALFIVMLLTVCTVGAREKRMVFTPFDLGGIEITLTDERADLVADGIDVAVWMNIFVKMSPRRSAVNQFQPRDFNDSMSLAGV